jgi:hypothetical protein
MLVHCIPALQPGRLVAVQGAGLLRVPHVDPSLVAEKAFAEADGKLSRKFMAKMEQAGVRARSSQCVVVCTSCKSCQVLRPDSLRHMHSPG